MLKINKILSKKIKSPLSLRGLFPFCHSRESGNPSSLSLRGTKQRSNLSGFSLIELMVAVVILAIALIGIFLAFSNAWMGMANARDRTVATNYAREAMENVKNMDFELVTHVNLGASEPVGAKFTRVIVVTEESANLKKIDTKVSWTNRQSQEVSVETSMYINRTIFNPGEATHIILYADPYYTVLPTSGLPPSGIGNTANIIAVIKDINNTTVIDWTGGSISFSIIPGPPGAGDGSLTSGAHTPGVTPTNGTAQTTFTGTAVGDVVIMASIDLPNDGGTMSDTITITVTTDVVRIELSADPYRIDANAEDTSIITATLVNSGGAPVTDAKNKITFNISEEGTFFDYETEAPLGNTTDIIPTSGGIAKIKVQSIDDTSGVATVTANSEGLLSGTVNIIIAGDATYISVSVEPDFIYTDDTDGATVTVEILDENRNPVEYSGKISLATSDGTGIFEHETDCDPEPTNPNPLCFDIVSSKYTTFSSTSVGTITITASGGGLIEDNATIEVREALIADTIILKANPKNILAGVLGGIVVSKITATIKQGSTVIHNYDEDITFEIVSDTSNSNDALLLFNSGEYGIDADPPLTVSGGDYDNDGVAVVDLKPATDVGICTVKVSTVNSLGVTIENTIEVGFYSGEHHIKLIANPPKMLVNGDSCIVTAEVVDELGTVVGSYNKDITFTILVGWPKNAKFAETGTSSLTKTLFKGIATVILVSQSEAGTVTLKASSFTDMTDITGYLNISVVTTLLELAPDPKINYDGNQVSFDIEVHDIEVQGTEISLVQMQVSWEAIGDPPETLNTIEIEIGETVVYSNDYDVTSGTVVDTVVALPPGIYTINLYFNESAVMSGKTLEVIFNTNLGNYPVEINEPQI